MSQVSHIINTKKASKRLLKSTLLMRFHAMISRMSWHLHKILAEEISMPSQSIFKACLRLPLLILEIFRWTNPMGCHLGRGLWQNILSHGSQLLKMTIKILMGWWILRWFLPAHLDRVLWQHLKPRARREELRTKMYIKNLSIQPLRMWDRLYKLTSNHRIYTKKFNWGNTN